MANLRTNNLSGEQGQNAYRGSVFFDGEEGSYLNLASGALISGTGFGTNDFTVEFWIHQGANASNYTNIISFYASTTTDRFQVAFHSSTIQVYTNTGSWADTGYAPTAGVYEHIAFVRNYSGNTLKMYANGEEKWSVSNNRDYDEVFETFIGDGPTSSYSAFQGYLSNLRVLNGTALYTTNYFTPPTTELTANENTVLLCCQDSDNPLKEETGRTITGFGSLQSVDDTELITNSGFTADISGWTASGVQWSHSSGALMHFGNGNTQRNIYQDVTTVIGNKYVFRVEASSAEADTAYWQILGSADLAGNNYIADNNNAAPLEHVFYFTADSTTTKIRFYSYDSSNSSNVRSYWYKASLKLAEQGKQPKVIPPYGVDAGNTFGGPIQQSSEGYMYFPTGRTEERGRGRGVLSGGRNNHAMQFVNIQSQGNSIIFGDSITGGGIEGFAVGSSTRGLFSGGYPSVGNVIEFITFATTSNGTDFGDMTTGRRSGAGAGNETRGLFAGGLNSGATSLNTIEFSTIATLGNSTDFGDLTQARDQFAGLADTTRGIFAGGVEQPGTQFNIIDFVTIATTGNAQDFGDMTGTNTGSSGSSDSTRGVIMVGYTSPAQVNTIDFVTIQSAGDAQDFGDLTLARYLSACMSNSTRAIFAGGGSPSASNTIDFVTIQTTGNASDFGDLSGGANFVNVGTSDSHGGLS